MEDLRVGRQQGDEDPGRINAEQFAEIVLGALRDTQVPVFPREGRLQDGALGIGHSGKEKFRMPEGNQVIDGQRHLRTSSAHAPANAGGDGVMG